MIITLILFPNWNIYQPLRLKSLSYIFKQLQLQQLKMSVITLILNIIVKMKKLNTDSLKHSCHWPKTWLSLLVSKSSYGHWHSQLREQYNIIIYYSLKTCEIAIWKCKFESFSNNLILKFNFVIFSCLFILENRVQYVIMEWEKIMRNFLNIPSTNKKCLSKTKRFNKLMILDKYKY